MATSNKRLFLTLVNKINKCNVLLSLGNNFRSQMAVIHYSTKSELQTGKLSKTMKAYIEKNREYDNFLREQLNEYNMGQKFLASMMGKKGPMSQEDIDEAIEYLFPCGLFVPKSRPVMKPPQDIFAKMKPVQFDHTGRPFHFLFYTGRPNYTQIMHDAASKLQKLNDYYYKTIKEAGTVDKKLVLVGNWIAKEDLEKMLLEKLYEIHYSKFLEVFNRLSEHPCAYLAEDFIKKYWVPLGVQKDVEIAEPIKLEDGTQIMTVNEARRKTASADVKVIYPGKGRIRINDLGLDYFHMMQSREQVIFPLLFTGMQKKVDVEATVKNGGETSQAGAVRLGISKALQSFVSHEMRMKMKLAGLLHTDVRRRERKKVARDGARKRYTWLKR